MCKSCFDGDAFNHLHENTHQHMPLPLKPLFCIFCLYIRNSKPSDPRGRGCHSQLLTRLQSETTNTHTPHAQTHTNHELDVYLIVKFIPLINITINSGFTTHEYFTSILGNLPRENIVGISNYCIVALTD